MASPIFKLKSITPVTTLKTAAGINEPPGEPVTNIRSPLLSNTITGTIVLIGLLPGANLFAGLAALPSMLGSPNL